MPPRAIEEYPVGWVCALPKEMAAARAVLDEEHEPFQSDNALDNNTYVLGRVGKHNVVMACLPAGVYGTNAAATVANNMLRTFTGLRFGLMVGIGGGIPNLEKEVDIRLGDVVVSQPDNIHGGVVQYDLGKTLGEGRFERKGFLRPPPTVLLTALSNLQAKHDLDGSDIPTFLADMIKRRPNLAKSGYEYPGLEKDYLHCSHHESSTGNSRCTRCQDGIIQREPRHGQSPVVHYGVIASGNELIKNAAERDQLGEDLGAKCVEMEAAGLMNDFPCIVIRGICDYADAYKNDLWQKYAATTAAAFAKELLSVVRPREVAGTKHLSTPTEFSKAFRSRPSIRLKILSLDGGGFRGLSSLIMLQTVFNMFKNELDPPQADLKPCEFFDLIGGTSTGGIIALMLGRLRMSIEKCIQAYSKLGEGIFATQQGFPHEELFDAARLKEAIQGIVETETGDKDAPLLDPLADKSCKVAVFTLNQYNIGHSEPEILRSYNVKVVVSDATEPWTIWEAARATCAAPTFFKSLTRGKPPRAVNWYDAGMGHNNPAYIVRSEAGRIWGKFGKMNWQEDIGLFLSLGTGVPKILCMEKGGTVAQLSAKLRKPLQLVEAMTRMVTDKQTVANKMNDEFSTVSRPQTYFRFNVEHDLSGVELFEYEKEGQIRMDTKTYMDSRKHEARLCASSMVQLCLPELPVPYRFADCEDAELLNRLERRRATTGQPADTG
jgi:nucleoside phosphorylase/patatin-like phospholipase/acyl hydrolase